ncbi:MAG: DUF5605 domain-containing protein [Treponema sp.]|jgi:hypothetical protein|nr:DUF5605 domain-containing protein [Treponema sp.]
MAITFPAQVERWDVFEAAAAGREDGNPFTGRVIRGTFRSKSETVTADGFYDGGGVYRVRFMPSFEETYSFELSGDFSGNSAPEEARGSFTVTPPEKGNHGPVRVANQYHFAYEDGTPYYSVGTTCYVWELQSDELWKKTLETLAGSPFNKIRFCIFPKHYDYNLHEPRSYPYEGNPMDGSVLTKENFSRYSGAMPGNSWDFTRFNTEHFRHIDRSVRALRDLGIEADIIVMHPYDRWGFSTMKRGEDGLYWKYVVARYAAFRNVWWSLANEYDLMPQKTIADWEYYAAVLCEKDPYNHPRSIHNCRFFYDHSRPWITHCSIQRQDLYKSAENVTEWRQRYKKPVVLDEIAYEGNIEHGWGNISGKELVRRFWEASCRGGYAGHGETFMHPRNILWWSHGGELHGESPARLKFLSDILRETPGLGLSPMEGSWDETAARAEVRGNGENSFGGGAYYLYYYGFMRPSFRNYYYGESGEYQAELIDTWEMTIKNCGVFRGKFRIDMPGKEYMAVRVRGI